MRYETEDLGGLWEFARCQRADGSFYGTRGTCRKGKKVEDAPEKESKAMPRGSRGLKAKPSSGDEVIDVNETNEDVIGLLKRQLKKEGRKPKSKGKESKPSSKESSKLKRQRKRAEEKWLASLSDEDRATVLKNNKMVDDILKEEKGKAKKSPEEVARIKKKREKEIRKISRGM